MAICAERFIFDDIPCEKYGLMICNFGSVSENGTISTIEVTKSSIPIQNKWFITGNVSYKEALSFKFQVAKVDFSIIDSYEQSAITRWLMRKDGYKRLQFIQNDFENIYFNVIVDSIKILTCGSLTYGLEISCIADSPFGYDHVSSIDTVLMANEPITYLDLSDEIGYIYPDLTITILQSGNLSIHNSIENRYFKVNNCMANEIIKINGDTLTMTSNINSHSIYNDFNFEFFRIANNLSTRKNVITSNLKCRFQMSLSPIRKVGV